MVWSNSYISVPFKDRGRSREGADCWGLTRMVYADRLNIDLPSMEFYADCRDNKKLADLIVPNLPKWEKVPNGYEKEYDVAVFNITGIPCHVGVVLQPKYMLHCQRGIGTTVERYDNKKWNNRIAGFYRYTESAGQPSSIFAASQNS